MLNELIVVAIILSMYMSGSVFIRFWLLFFKAKFAQTIIITIIHKDWRCILLIYDRHCEV